MLRVLQVATVCLVSIGLALALAHVAELPGKMRLSKEDYLAVQPIYYPGFTIGGFIGEFGGIVSVLLLLIATPRDSEPFRWIAAALASLIAMHVTYWVWTHPVNKVWLKNEPLTGFGATFFSFAARSGGSGGEWTALRNAWEYSHVARALFALIGLVCLLIAVTF